jgi:AcrR family transcriptional regulator
MADKVKRRYESPRRRAQADATKRDILAAAQRLFERQGYAATTMAAIAAEAGVALKTVYLAFETKGGVLRGVWNALLRGEDDRPVDEHAWYREVLDEPDPDRRLALNARNSTQGKLRVSAIAQVIREAAPTDEEIGALWDRIQTEYRENQRAIAERLDQDGRLAPGLDVERAADILWTINHPNTWQLLVAERGWAPEEYQRWAGERLSALEHAPRNRLGALDGRAGEPAPGAGVRTEDDVRVEHRDQRIEVARPRGGQERVHNPALLGQAGVLPERGAAHAPPAAARELPGRVGTSTRDGADLVERHREHVVQDERQPLGRGQRLQHDQEREPDRVGDQRLVLG